MHLFAFSTDPTIWALGALDSAAISVIYFWKVYLGS